MAGEQSGQEPDPARAERHNELIGLLIHRLFGLDRFTHDAAIKPDAWTVFLKRALAGWGGEKASLILTPKQTPAMDGRPAGHAGHLAEKIRKRILGPRRPRVETRMMEEAERARVLAEEEALLGDFMIAATRQHVAVEATFEETIRYLLPLTAWWRRQTDVSVDTLIRELEERAQGASSLRNALIGFERIEFLRFVALACLVARFNRTAADREEQDRQVRFSTSLVPRGVRSISSRETIDVLPRRLRADPVELAASIEDVVALLKEFEDIAPRPSDDTGEDSDIEIAIWSIQVNRSTFRQAKRTSSASMIPGRAQRPADTVKADAARKLFSIATSHIVWGVVDTGIDAGHQAFRLTGQGVDKPAKRRGKAKEELGEPESRVLATLNFTLLQELLSEGSVLSILDRHFPAAMFSPDERAGKLKQLQQAAFEIREGSVGGRQLDWSLLERVIKYDSPAKAPPPSDNHGTHVAGILGGDFAYAGGGAGDAGPPTGVCPDIRLYDLRVFGRDDGELSGGDEFTVLAALDYVAWLNRDPMRPAIHGINLSLALPFEVNAYACGRTPVCDACDRLVWNGTVVVAAAGNFGFDRHQRDSAFGVGYRGMSITDPGNAREVITVGATHHSEPHTYGVSYFSSRGPTGDGRLKPDLVAPGEKIRSSVAGGAMDVMDGTSMAAPHVSGVCALLMGRYAELIGEPERIKRILMDTATDLGRDRHFQGAGLVDALRALQSV